MRSACSGRSGHPLVCLLLRWILFAIASGVIPADGIKVLAPEECGGTRVVPHISANYGPRLEETDQELRAFAPFPQRDGNYTKDSAEFNAIVRKGTPAEDINTKSLFDGCTPLSVQGDIEKIKSRVAIVERGGCDFVVKAINMQNQGAVGVILVNTGKPDVQQLSLPNTTVDVSIEYPEVMIGASDWSRIAYCRDNLSVILTSVGQAQFHLDFTNKPQFSRTMIRCMALWILFQCGVNVFRYKRRHSELSARADAISRLPVFRYSRRSPAAGPGMEEVLLRGSGTGEADSDDDPICTICLEGFEQGDCTRVLACQHIFHQSCLDPWLAQSSSCPVCKRDIPDLPPPSSHLHQYGALATV